MTKSTEIAELIKNSIDQLLNYCIKNDWAGYDPFDGLSSRVFNATPLKKNRFARLALIQGMKRSPINLRQVLLVSREHNPKGLALFCSALINFSGLEIVKDENVIKELLNRLILLRSPDKPRYCWGYNFDWQSRYMLVPKYEPNIIATTFAGHALIDAYEKYSDKKYLDMAISAGKFLIEGLNITETNDDICFSYTPFDYGKIHNANLLGAAYLARVYSKTKDRNLLTYAKKSVKFSVNRQNEDGSWYYGEHETQKWIDNFHTGYNLIALQNYSIYTKNEEFLENIQRGYKYYLDNFFSDNALPKYYHNNLYPIDIHSIAQSIITLVRFKSLDERSMDIAIRMSIWAIKNMKSNKGYFYYQKKRLFKIRIPYMRWSQAWMLYALAIWADETFDVGLN